MIAIADVFNGPSVLQVKRANNFLHIRGGTRLQKLKENHGKPIWVSDNEPDTEEK